MKIVFNKSIDKIDRTDFWIRYIILLIVDFIVNFVLAMIQLSLHTDFTSISGIIIYLHLYVSMNWGKSDLMMRDCQLYY